MSLNRLRYPAQYKKKFGGISGISSKFEIPTYRSFKRTVCLKSAIRYSQYNIKYSKSKPENNQRVSDALRSGQNCSARSSVHRHVSVWRPALLRHIEAGIFFVIDFSYSIIVDVHSLQEQTTAVFQAQSYVGLPCTLLNKQHYRKCPKQNP